MRGFIVSREDKLKAEIAGMLPVDRKAIGDFIRYLNLRDAQSQRANSGSGSGKKAGHKRTYTRRKNVKTSVKTRTTVTQGTSINPTDATTED